MEILTEIFIGIIIGLTVSIFNYWLNKRN
ncbi:type I toxin-antitoxin system Fst family toxin [Priestia megaterium]